MLKDSRSYETQLIDAVRSVNRALGGTYGTSSAIYKNEFNQYEVQLIDAIKGIGRTLSGKGLSISGGIGGASEEALQDLARRVTKLENESFFRLVNGNVTLKEQYRNLWVPGWLAAGGIGSGSGSLSFLKGLEDVYHDDTGILRADGETSVQPGDTLVYDDDLDKWVASAGGGGGSTSIEIEKLAITTDTMSQIARIRVDGGSWTYLYNDVGWGTYDQTNHTVALTVNGTTRTVALDGYGGGGGGGSTVSVSQILTSGTAIASISVDGTSTTLYAPSGGGGSVTGYIGTTQVQSTSSAQALTGILSVKASSATSSLMEWDSTNNAWHFYGNVYADGWVTAGGIGSGGGGGGGATFLGDLSDVSLSSPSNGQALIYRNGVWQNETIQGGGGSTVYWGTPGSDYVPLTVDGTTKNILTSHQSLSGYVTLSTPQTIDGAKTFTTNPVTIGSSSGVSVDGSSYIDIGDARLVWDSTNHALHVTKRPGSSYTGDIGVYADGYVAAGGIQ